MTKGKEHPVIAFLSVSPKEGKTYNVINIASSFALIPKRVVILDLDLRNPKMRKEFNIESDLGIVDYIIGKAGLEEIIFQTKHPMLNVIPAGAVPPNPAEILLNNKIFELINMLKENYDVIIADSTPLGTVTDILPLSDIIDASVIIVRNKLTEKKELKNILKKVESYDMKEPGIIIYNTGRRKNKVKY
jgi:capsular exopolysaccharide synthesis family protein